jgi:hypothetical protein
MSQSRLLLGLLFASCSLSAFACASPTDASGENVDSQEGDVKKKVKPKGGNGAFDLVAPSFNATGFAGTFSFDNGVVKAGDRSEKVPGAYLLQGQAGSFPEGGSLMNQQLTINLTAGAIAKHQLGGLRIRFAEPITLGSARVDLSPERGSGGFLSDSGAWRTTANGASMLVLAGKIGITSSADSVRTEAVVAEGALKEVVLPTARVALVVDAYDPAYPTPANCAQPYVRSADTGYTANAAVRKADGSPNASFVVPQGVRAPVSIDAYGIAVAQPTLSGQTHTFTLNRLEIDDVEVAQAGGGSVLVKGSSTIGRKNPDGSFTSLNCTFPTHTGVDLPDGTYRVSSRAQSASGLVTSTEDVTFP